MFVRASKTDRNSLMLSFGLWNDASETTSTFPLGQQTIFGCWGNAGPLPASWSRHGISSIREYHGGASMSKCHRYSICQPITQSLASHSAVHVHKMPTWAVAMAATPSSSYNPDSILVQAMLWPHNPPSPLFLFLSSLPCFLQMPDYWETFMLAVFPSTLVANRSQYFCPLVSCVTCPLYHFPLVVALTASVGLPGKSGYCADPQILH